jgi:hypothetical protein
MRRFEKRYFTRELGRASTNNVRATGNQRKDSNKLARIYLYTYLDLNFCGVGFDAALKIKSKCCNSLEQNLL